VQLAVRSLIERGVLEMSANLYGVAGPETCLNGYDPLFASNTTAGPTGAFYPAYDNLGTNNALSRAEPSRWHASRDDVPPPAPVAVASRGRY
jgi:hypothetical protein